MEFVTQSKDTRASNRPRSCVIRCGELRPTRPCLPGRSAPRTGQYLGSNEEWSAPIRLRCLGLEGSEVARWPSVCAVARVFQALGGRDLGDLGRPPLGACSRRLLWTSEKAKHRRDVLNSYQGVSSRHGLSRGLWAEPPAAEIRVLPGSSGRPVRCGGPTCVSGLSRRATGAADRGTWSGSGAKTTGAAESEARRPLRGPPRLAHQRAVWHNRRVVGHGARDRRSAEAQPGLQREVRTPASGVEAYESSGVPLRTDTHRP